MAGARIGECRPTHAGKWRALVEMLKQLCGGAPLALPAARSIGSGRQSTSQTLACLKRGLSAAAVEHPAEHSATRCARSGAA